MELKILVPSVNASWTLSSCLTLLKGCLGCTKKSDKKICLFFKCSQRSE